MTATAVTPLEDVEVATDIAIAFIKEAVGGRVVARNHLKPVAVDADGFPTKIADEYRDGVTLVTLQALHQERGRAKYNLYIDVYMAPYRGTKMPRRDCERLAQMIATHFSSRLPRAGFAVQQGPLTVLVVQSSADGVGRVAGEEILFTHYRVQNATLTWQVYR